MSAAPERVSMYRSGGAIALAVLPAPPLWQRLAALLPGVGRRWQWFRAAKRGQWAVLFTRRSMDGVWETIGWHRVPECPAKETHGNAYRRSECTAEACKCEVWP